MRGDENPFENMFGKMGQMEGMEDQLKKAQENLLNVSVTGEAGAGMVKVEFNGNAGVQKVHIDDEVYRESKEVLQDLLATAFTDAYRKVEVAKQERFMSMLGNMAPGAVPGGAGGSVPPQNMV